MANNKPKNVEEYIKNATENIEADRALASQLLFNLIGNMTVSQADNRAQRSLGEVAAKYLETLQRSNEQLVKVAEIIHKINSSKKDSDKVSKQEMENLYEELLGGEK